MTHKTMFFIALLVSATSTYCVESIAMQIQELKDYRFKKELELSDLGKMISEKDELFQSMWQAANNFSLKLINEKKKSLNLNEQEVKEFTQALNTSLANFGEALNEAIIIKKNVKQFFVKELLDERNRESKGLETLKFHIIRNSLEFQLLRTLIERYEEGHQELIEINSKLADLQKQI
jgi:hypothetical protein